MNNELLTPRQYAAVNIIAGLLADTVFISKITQGTQEESWTSRLGRSAAEIADSLFNHLDEPECPTSNSADDQNTIPHQRVTGTVDPTIPPPYSLDDIIQKCAEETFGELRNTEPPVVDVLHNTIKEIKEERNVQNAQIATLHRQVSALFTANESKDVEITRLQQELKATHVSLKQQHEITKETGRRFEEQRNEKIRLLKSREFNPEDFYWTTNGGTCVSSAQLPFRVGLSGSAEDAEAIACQHNREIKKIFGIA